MAIMAGVGHRQREDVEHTNQRLAPSIRAGMVTVGVVGATMEVVEDIIVVEVVLRTCLC